jgi:Na+/H+-dicarboxylate symporter
VLVVVHAVMRLAPVAVFCLVAKVMATMGLEALGALLVYCLTVVLGLVLVTFGVYPALLRAFAKVGPRRFFTAIAPAQLLAFSSSSSNATLPVTMECVEERLGVSEEITSFVIPLGATVNMDGTALYQGVAAVFIAQLYGIDLTLGDQLTIVLTATLASIGTAGVPGVGLVMLVIVLQAVGMGDDAMRGGIAIIFGVDRLLDMCRTVTNVTGDCVVAAVVAHQEGELAAEAPAAA